MKTAARCLSLNDHNRKLGSKYCNYNIFVNIAGINAIIREPMKGCKNMNAAQFLLGPMRVRYKSISGKRFVSAMYTESVTGDLGMPGEYICPSELTLRHLLFHRNSWHVASCVKVPVSLCILWKRRKCAQDAKLRNAFFRLYKSVSPKAKKLPYLVKALRRANMGSNLLPKNIQKHKSGQIARVDSNSCAKEAGSSKSAASIEQVSMDTIWGKNYTANKAAELFKNLKHEVSVLEGESDSSGSRVWSCGDDTDLESFHSARRFHTVSVASKGLKSTGSQYFDTAAIAESHGEPVLRTESYMVGDGRGNTDVNDIDDVSSSNTFVELSDGDMHEEGSEFNPADETQNFIFLSKMHCIPQDASFEPFACAGDVPSAYEKESESVTWPWKP